MKSVNRMISVVLSIMVFLSVASAFPQKLRAGINTYESTIEVSDTVPRCVGHMSELSPFADGATFTVTLKLTEGANIFEPVMGSLYIASSRASVDMIYFKDLNGDWILTDIYGGLGGATPTVYEVAGDLDGNSAVLEVISTWERRLTMKIVSKAPGTSQIVFGTDPDVVYEYSRGLPVSDRLGSVIGQKRWPVKFEQPLPKGLRILSVDGTSGHPFPFPPDFNGVIPYAGNKAADGSDYYTLNAYVSSAYDGMPVAEVDVFFSIVSGTGAFLSDSKVTTGLNGKASTKIFANKPGDYEILAWVPGIPEQESPDSWQGNISGSKFRNDKVQVTFYVPIRYPELPRIRLRLVIDKPDYRIGEDIAILDVPPTIVNGRTMVPLRFIAEALGAKVDWNNDTRTAAVALDNKTLSVTVDKAADGMDVPPMIINGRTMVPLRYIGEALGCDVAWDPDTRAIDITRQ